MIRRMSLAIVSYNHLCLEHVFYTVLLIPKYLYNCFIKIDPFHNDIFQQKVNDVKITEFNVSVKVPSATTTKNGQKAIYAY